MHDIFNLMNLKALITFMHLAGLAFGVGGAWIIDALLIKYLHNPITDEKYHTIAFVSKTVLLGLVLLWISGILFLMYYYLFTPGLLSNQKIWAKIAIVTILSSNGILIHQRVLPKLKASIGLPLLQSLNSHELKTMTTLGTVSFVSWLFPVLLGVLRSLNCTVPAADILLVYILFLSVAICIGLFFMLPFMLRKTSVCQR